MFSSSIRKHAPGCPKFRRTLEEERQIGNVRIAFFFLLFYFTFHFLEKYKIKIGLLTITRELFSKLLLLPDKDICFFIKNETDFSKIFSISNLGIIPIDECKNSWFLGIASCYDKFALAKRLHAENLQHQPLPDRVDDSVFKREYRTCSANCKYIAAHEDRANKKKAEDYSFGPTLGCKEPKTRMDLAICWETPVDPVYEPHRSTHIDGSEGGSAPAIFAMIQHTSTTKNPELLAFRNSERKDTECTCAGQEECSKRDPCCCDRLRKSNIE